MQSEAADVTTKASLLLRLRDIRDREAWVTFVEVYGPLVFSYCRRHQLQDCDAADVSQEVLIRLSKALQKFEYQVERGRFRDWLGAVTHRELLQFWKRQKRSGRLQADGGQQQVELFEDSKSWNHHFHSALIQQAMTRIRSDFEAETWSIFEQLWLEEKAPADVARSFGQSIGSVYVAKSRVLKRLRTEVLLLSDDLPLLEKRRQS